MGTKVNALDDQNQNQYVQGVNKMLQIFGNRFFTPWKRIEFLFTTFASDGPIYKKIIEVSQNFTNSVIQQKMANQKQSTETWDDCGIKKKIALIDTLIKPENRLTQEEIRAEIDTFMFEVLNIYCLIYKVPINYLWTGPRHNFLGNFLHAIQHSKQPSGPAETLRRNTFDNW